MDADAARRLLLGQHQQIRDHLESCSALARQLLAGAPVQWELDAALAQLRHGFAEHNMTETDLVRPLLRDSPGWGTALIDRMLEEHVAEHAAFWALLSGSVSEMAERMNDLIDELDAHMAAEERTFLSPLVLHPDAITRRRES